VTVAAVQARIAAIEARFAPLSVPASANSTSFDAVLKGLLEPGSTATAGTSGASVRGDDAVKVAMKYLGVPYRWGGTDPSTGVDCSGLTQLVFGQLGIDLPRVASDQAKAGQPVANLSEALPGDLVFFGSPVDHVGVYAGNGNMVVAPHTGDVVKIQKIYEAPSAIRRVSASGSSASSDLQTLFSAATRRYGLPDGLLEAIGRVESGLRTDALSPAGAQGLMQLMPATARGRGVDPFDPAQAVDGAARLLSASLDAYGSVPLALAAYNAGGGAVARYGGIPPVPETQAYVRKVLDIMGVAG
jgi:cell wall-associated NlpC family hydrolase